jgi:16S rRNA (cytosine1402-N4)-methyltransferase
MPHVPVLLNEIIEALDPKPGEFFIDGTFGSGGHTVPILEKMMPSGKLLAVDWDKNNLEKTKKLIETKFQIPNPNFQIFWVHDNYKNLPRILKQKNLPKADGLLLDLGFSSEQLENSGRGFSFKREEPLLMTYSDASVPVRQLLNRLSEKELVEIIWKFGEEKYAKKIAQAIIFRQKQKPIQTSKELADIIKGAVPLNYERGRIHPATRTFQALRIYANRELENLEALLKNLEKIVKPNGRIAIVSFHSLEDRLVKNYFRDLAKMGKLKILNKKPIIPTSEEVFRNPRSRSAKLRVAQLTSNS